MVDYLRFTLHSILLFPVRFIFRADASREIGSGHVMRSLALAEEAISRGFDCIFVGKISDLDWVSESCKDGIFHVGRIFLLLQSGLKIRCSNTRHLFNPHFRSFSRKEELEVGANYL